MKILFLTPRFPYPLIGGDRLKPYHIISHLCKKHEVTLITFFQGKNLPQEHIDIIKNLGIELHIVKVKPVIGGLRAGALTLIKGFPLEIAYYNYPEFFLIVNELHKKKNFDLGIAFFMRTAEYLKKMQLKKILMAEDCRTLYQKRSSEESRNILQKIIRYWEHKKLEKYEPSIVNYFDISTFVTVEDIENMKIENPNAKYRLLTNGTDINKFVLPDDSIVRSGILFAGKLDIWANVLMLQNIIHHIFPIIKQRLPDASFTIVGGNPTKAIRDLISGDIKLITNVPEMVPYLQKAQVFLHPHSGGTGIQNKLLEAMACGCPVVTTPTGIQGIQAAHGVDVMIGKSNEELAEHTIKIIENKQLAANIGRNARKLMVETHSWESVFLVMDDILNEIIAG